MLERYDRIKKYLVSAFDDHINGSRAAPDPVLPNRAARYTKTLKFINEVTKELKTDRLTLWNCREVLGALIEAVCEERSSRDSPCTSVDWSQTASVVTILTTKITLSLIQNIKKALLVSKLNPYLIK